MAEMVKSQEEETEESPPSPPVQQIKPEEVLQDLLKAEPALKEQEAESIMPARTGKARLFVYDELLCSSVLKRYLDKPHTEMRVHVPRHRLTFPKYFAPSKSGLAHIERSGIPEDEVWGVTIDISNQDLSRLNRYKGAPNRYHLKTLWVMDRGGLRYPVTCYAVSVKDSEPSRPSRELLNLIIQGARERRLPASYIKWLESIETL